MDSLKECIRGMDNEPYIHSKWKKRKDERL